MSRRRAAEKRTILPDHKYKDLTLAKFMNRIMLDGKKSTSEKIVEAPKRLLSKMKATATEEAKNVTNIIYNIHDSVINRSMLGTKRKNKK